MFLDLSKAFDKGVRETLFGMHSGEISIETRLLALVLSQAAAKHIAAHIDKSGGLLRDIGVPDVIAELVADLNDSAWFHLTPTGRTIVTREGTLQGCKFGASMLCNVQYGRVLRELREALASAGLLTPVTYRYGALPWTLVCDEYTDCLCCRVMDGTYADDEAILVQANNDELIG